MKAKTYNRIANGLYIFFWLCMIYIFAHTCVSCTSKSGELSKIPAEKVVIIDSYEPIDMKNTNDGKMYHYKVKRISHGVIDIIYDYNLYESGDTIYHKFTSYGR